MNKKVELLTRIQKKKIKHLLKRGAVVDNVLVRVETLHGGAAIIDKHGRVRWER